ncbi:MAG: transglycosylase domain-containing protein [Proteobacteria bacterium]|nr:transglycosylase domain-containing protein [Pseudomonadota bacterium]
MKKIAILSAVILGLIVMLGIAYVTARHLAITKITDTLQARLPKCEIVIEDTGLLERPDCIKSVSINGPGIHLTSKDICLTSGLRSLSSTGTPLEIFSASAVIQIDTDEFLKSPPKASPSEHGRGSGLPPVSLKAAKIDADVKTGSRRTKLTVENAALDHDQSIWEGNASVTPNEIDGLPFILSSPPPFKLNFRIDRHHAEAECTIEPEQSFKANLTVKDIDTAFSLDAIKLSADRDTLTASLSGASVTFPEQPHTASIEAQNLTVKTSLHEPLNVRSVDIESPSLTLNLKLLLQNPAVAKTPFLKELLDFWKQDAGAYLGDAPNKSVRRADVKRPKPPVRKNPISREKVASFKSFLNDIQLKMLNLPAIEIRSGRIDLENDAQHIILSDLDFSTSEIVRDAQDFQIKFKAQDALATLDLRFDPDNSYPTLGLDIRALPSEAFLKILNLPIPDNNSGTIDLRSTLALKDDCVSFDSSVSMQAFAFYEPKISPNIVHDINLDFTVDAEYGFSTDRLDISRLTVRSGPVTASGHMSISDMRSNPVISFEIGAEDVQCADIAKAIPPGLFPTITDIDFAGSSFSPKISGLIPWNNPLTAKLKETGFDNTCLPIRVLPHIPERLNASDFVHTTDYTYFADSIQVGPGTPGYTKLEAIPPFVKAAMFLTEDKRFFDHGPLRIAFIERALRLNLNQRKYVYGGSTIAQQLTKNLFLNRNKNLARKLEEAFIAWRMVTVVPKSRIFELYVNVIEFGPDIYGISNGAAFYFGKAPRDLEPLEGAFLASLKVAPSKGGRLYKNGFSANGSWWKKRQRYILKVLAENGYISVADVIAAYDWVPSFDYPSRPGDSRHTWLRQYGEFLKEHSDKSPHSHNIDSEPQESEFNFLKPAD